MNSNIKGIYGENIAAKELVKNGYFILDKNYHSMYGEIDIVAKKDCTVVFVEVKLRKNIKNGMPCEAVDLRKQRKIIKTAQEYIQRRNLTDCDFRFDVIEILAADKIMIRHIKNAFWE